MLGQMLAATLMIAKGSLDRCCSEPNTASVHHGRAHRQRNFGRATRHQKP
jgi:hypothetical protein